jgi:Tfp pilus assembly protein PilX
MTIIVLFIVMLLITVIFNDGISALPIARNSQNYQAALQAAESGVEDFINRLDNNTTYYTTTTDTSNPALQNGVSPWTATSPACSGCTGTWAAVPGTTVNEWYRYVINDSQTGRSGVVYLTVTGAAGQNPAVAGDQYSLRTIKVGINLNGFTSFLYYTDYEIEAPTISGLNASQCVFHAWQYNNAGGYGPPSSCSSELIYFVGNSVEQDGLNGPVYSNDALHICGDPAFPDGAVSAYDQSNSGPTNADVTTGPQSGWTSYGGEGAYVGDSSCTNAPTWYGVTNPTTLTPPEPVQPTGSTDTPFPTTNTSLATDTGSTYDGGGCLYTGPITVSFNGTKMSVQYASGATYTSATPSTCIGNNINLPPNGLLYDETNKSCGSTSCQADPSVSGTVTGQVTVGSDNNITITGNLGDTGGCGSGPPSPCSASGTNIIGLSAADSIILNPTPFNSSLTIDAAMVALNDSMYLNNWASQPTGTLNIYGSIAQEFRGPVGTFNSGGIVSGYSKNYNYDTRLKYLQPPYFTSPTLPNWTKSSLEECNPTAGPTTSWC